EDNNPKLVAKTGALNDRKAELAARQADYNSAEKTGGLYFQVGANANQGMQLYINSVKTDSLDIGDGHGVSTISVLNDTGANITAQLDTLDNALSYVTTERAKLGAAQNRLEYTMSSLDISAENLTAAESRIRDVDMAKEMTNFTKSNILFQASTAMLAQANSFPQGVLQLLG
ncbi:MAG: flagellin, partial [Oscillospiraceae bacterium]|nr:flagellin [Oscillospiraceae bacterium]